MELAESIESLNRQLVDLFGIDTASNNPIWRIVWAEDQTEMQMVTAHKGVEFIHPIPKEIIKYPHIKERYILEKYEIVPEKSREQLCGAKTAYNVIFVFENEKVGYLPPRLDVAKYVIDTLNYQLGKGPSPFKKYVENPTEENMKEFNRIQEQLFGDETDVTDALTYKEGVVVPSKFFGEN